jgi:hypothetical protein
VPKGAKACQRVPKFDYEAKTIVGSFKGKKKVYFNARIC